MKNSIVMHIDECARAKFGARARARQNPSAQCSFFKMLEHVPSTES